MDTARHRGMMTPNELERVDLRLADAFEFGAFSEATHLYMLSTCFNRGMFVKLLSAIAGVSISSSTCSSHTSAGGCADANVGNVVSRTPSTVNVHWIVSSQPIPHDLLERHNAVSDMQIVLRMGLEVPTSWTHKCALSIYRRVPLIGK